MHLNNPSPPPPKKKMSLALQVYPADVITRVKVNGSAEVLAEMDRIKDAPLRTRTEDGRYRSTVEDDER